MSCMMKEQLEYNPGTGLFTYKKSAGRRRAGELAGGLTTHGYVSVGICGKRVQAHVLAWYFMTGEWPKHLIDHKDGIKSNNKWSNLRPANKPQNAANAKLRYDNSVGVKGVRVLKDTGKFQVRVNSKSYGCYSDLELAEFVAKEVRHSLHGEFARDL